MILSQSVTSDTSEHDAIMADKPQQLSQGGCSEHSHSTFRSSTTSASSAVSTNGSSSSLIPSATTRKRVRFSNPDANLIVPPPMEPLSPTEKRAVFYTAKELEVKHQCDLDNYNNYLVNKSKRHSFGWHSSNNSNGSNHEDDPNRRSSAPADCGSGGNGSEKNNNSNNHNHHHHIPHFWRGLEQHKTGQEGVDKRNSRVKQVVQAVVAQHHQLVTKNAQAAAAAAAEGGASSSQQPVAGLLSEELRKIYQRKSRQDRIRAEELGMQDAKDALGKIEVVKDLLTHKHTTHNNSPQRQFRKVSMLAKMSVSGVVGSISVASF